MSFPLQTPTTNPHPPPDDGNLRDWGQSVLPEKNRDGQEETVPARGTLPVPEVGTQNRYVTLAVCGLLLLAVALVFGQTARHGFVNLDDDRGVYNSPHVTGGLTVSGVAWALIHRSPGIGGWEPLTLVSHAAVWQCCGPNAGVHHLVNVLLQAASAVLLFLVLRSMTGRFWPSALVAALFAIHPLRVESVAWVTERKDVLSGLFFMLTLWAYANYVRHPFSFARYVAVMVFLALGIMSKSIMMTLPAVLLLLDYWPLGRITTGKSKSSFDDPSAMFLRWLPRAVRARLSPSPATTMLAEKRINLRSRLVGLVLEKFPLLAFVPIAVLQELCYEAETAVVAPEDHVSLPWRLGNALVSYVTYLGKTVWPTGLIPLYLHPKDSLPVGHIIGAAVLLVCISAAALALWRRCPYLLIGWLWYLGILLPASGVVEFGYGLQAMADRFTYLPQIGLYLAFVWAVADLCRRWSFRRWACGGASVLALAIFMGCAWRQTSFWRDSTTLWTHAVACSPQTMLVHRLLGGALLDQRRTREAVQQLREALELKPHSVTTNYNLGTALAAAGRLDEAIFYYRRALEIRPDFAIAHCALASALTQQGRLDEALAHYRRSVELQPNDALAHEGMGGILCRPRSVRRSPAPLPTSDRNPPQPGHGSQQPR